MIKEQPQTITIKNKNQQVLASLTFFQLPNREWLVEQLFGSSNANRQHFTANLIQAFFKQISPRQNCVRILDPFVKSYLQRHPEYQKYLHHF